jgi:hypothetical protein
LSPSRSSTASCAPVLAPLGTAARPTMPLSRITSASTVGLPRLSRISRAFRARMVLIVIGVSCGVLFWLLVRREPEASARDER